MAYVPLPIVEAKLDDLRLDLDNYRIPTQPRDEAAALKYLFASEDVLEAARLILRDGYFDNEVPIVTDDGGASGYVVLEGNRRVSALKALHDPSLILGHVAEVEALLKRWATEAQDLPTVIRVLVAPDRATARPHIARLHTGLSKRRWSRDQQATFYYSLLDDTTTVDDVKAQYPSVEVVRFMKMAVVRRFLVAVPFVDPSLHDYVAGNSLLMSVFEYAYRSKAIAEAIGLAFDRDGQLLPRTSTPQEIAAAVTSDQLSALEYLVNEFRADRLNTRSPELKKTRQEHQDLIARLGRAPAASPSGTSPTDDAADPANTSAGSPSANPDEAEDGAATSGQRGPNHPDTKARLDLSGLEYASTPVNLQRRYYELRAISVKDLPVSAAILLRAVFEMTIKVHFEPNPNPASGTLGEIFPSVDRAYGRHKPLKNTVAAIKSGSAQRPGSLQWFNRVSHDVNAVVSADDVRQAWEQINPLLRRLLRPAT